MITWDESKRAMSLKDHRIDFADLDPFFDGDLLTREDTRESYGERRFQSIGLINGVALFVIWTPRGVTGDIPHVISARKAVNHEQKAWSQRYQKRR
ncbi:MAG: BrnT family toxin [Methylococcales bacterium]